VTIIDIKGKIMVVAGVPAELAAAQAAGRGGGRGGGAPNPLGVENTDFTTPQGYGAKNEYVVISAHLDHVGLAAANASGDRVSNGADDDGSGSAALMAVARAYALGAAKGIRPKRTVIFLWVAGEDKGLWGSQYFNQFPPVDITKVVANLNMDMIGRSKPQGCTDPPSYKLVEPGEVFVVGPSISSDDLGKVVESVAADHGKLKVNYFYDTTAPDATHDNLGPQPNGQRIFYRSDHYNFAKMGIPAAFYTTGLHPDYHRVTDSPEKLDYKSMQAITRNVAAVGWAVANASARPRLKARLPDQLINDMKAAQAQGWGQAHAGAAAAAGDPVLRSRQKSEDRRQKTEGRMRRAGKRWGFPALFFCLGSSPEPRIPSPESRLCQAGVWTHTTPRFTTARIAGTPTFSRSTASPLTITASSCLPASRLPTRSWRSME
jgi:hypothetical protein